MANYFTDSGIVDTNSNPQLLNIAIETMWNRRNEFVGNLAPYFNEEQKTGGGLTHQMSSVGSALPLPQENQDTEALPYFITAPGYPKTFALLSYRSGIRVTDTQMKADRFDKTMFTVSGQLKSAMQKDEYLRAAIFNGAFTGTDGADSLSLCNDSHPHENVERGTWDNASSGALTGATLQALWLLADQMTNEQGDPDPVELKDLLVPPALRQKAMELTKSEKRAEDALNGKTVLIGTLNVVVSHYLGLSSSVQHFGIGNRESYNKGLHQITLIPWNLKDNSPSNADIVVDKRIKAVYALGFTTSKNVIGSTGA